MEEEPLLPSTESQAYDRPRIGWRGHPTFGSHSAVSRSAMQTGYFKFPPGNYYGLFRNEGSQKYDEFLGTELEDAVQ